MAVPEGRGGTGSTPVLQGLGPEAGAVTIT